MNRSIKAVLGGVAALALAAGGLSTAAATEKTTKEVSPWQSIDADYVLPAGSACAHDVKVKERGRARDTVYRNAEGKIVKVFAEFDNRSTVKFSARVKKHHKKVTRSIKLNEGGDSRAYFKGGGKVFVKAEGTNWGQGAGIYGIPWSNGDITFTVLGDGDPKKQRIVNLDFVDVKRVIQVCYKIGSRPVAGKNIGPEEVPSAS
jgi:hypothetical protein